MIVKTKGLYNFQQAAEILGVSKESIRKLVLRSDF